MCDPVTAAVLAGGQFAIGAMSSIQAHNAQAKQYDANAAASNAAYVDEISQLNQRQVQEEAAASQEQQQNNIEAAKALASARVGAGERGVTGQTVELGFNDLIGQNLRDNTTIGTNLENTMTSLQWEKKAADSRRISRINSVNRPSKSATGLQIASSAVNAGTSYAGMTK